MSKEPTGRTQVIKQAFQGLDSDGLDVFREHAEERVYPADHILCHEGEHEDLMYIIDSGRVIITQAIDEDDDRILAFRGPGHYFGEMSLITGAPRSATIKTVEETTVLEVSRDTFEKVFAASPSLARSLLRTVIMNTREADQSAIRDLRAQNDELEQAYNDLREAQEDLVAAERLERELEIAGEVQRSLLPDRLPDVPGFTFAARTQPARHVGGDVYDVMLLPDGQIALLLADVSDKGVHASLLMAVTRTLFRTQARHQPDPVSVVRAVHDGLMDVSTSDMFVTAFYGVLDPASGRVRYVRAGHDEPLRVRADGNSEFLGGKGRFLGMLPEPPIADEQQITLEPGDSLVIYSDGVTDMTNPTGEPYGVANLERAVVAHRDGDAEAIAAAIVDGVNQHRLHRENFDDMTLVVVRAT